MTTVKADILSVSCERCHRQHSHETTAVLRGRYDSHLHGESELVERLVNPAHSPHGVSCPVPATTHTRDDAEAGREAYVRWKEEREEDDS